MSKEDDDKRARVEHAKEMARLQAEKRLADQAAARKRNEEHQAEMARLRKETEDKKKNK
jgi:hypothetical protein